MKKLFLSALLILAANSLLATGWTTVPVSSAASGTTVNAVAEYSSGGGTDLFVVIYLQRPDGSYQMAVNHGGAFAPVSVTLSQQLLVPGNHTWTAYTMTSSPPPSPSTGTLIAGPTVTNVPKLAQTTISISPLNPTVNVNSTVTFTATGGGVGGYTWSGAAYGTGPTITVPFYYVVTTNLYVQSPGDATYNPSNQPSTTITVQKLPQTIVYSTEPPTTVTFGDVINLTAASECPDGITYSQVGGTGHVQLSFNGANFDHAGTVTIAATQLGNDNYLPATEVDRTITVNPQAATFSLSASSFVYNGTLQGPSVIPNPIGVPVTIGGTPSATAKGNYTATATTSGDYSGTNNSLTWAITEATQAPVRITGPFSMLYGDSPIATAEDGSGLGALVWALGTGSTPTGAVINPSSGAVTAAGTGTVKINVYRAGDGNYYDSATTADFPINVTARPITVTLSGSKPFDGSTTLNGQSSSVTAGSLAPGDSITFNYINPPSAAAGQYPGLVTATIKNGAVDRTSSYSITYNGNYTIGSSNLTAITLSNKTYTGSPQTADAWSSITPSGASATISATSQTNAGPYTATVSGANGYGGTLTNVPWSITPANQGAVTINSGTSMVYGNAYPASATGGSGTGTISWSVGAASTPSGGTIAANGAVTATGSGTVKIKAQRTADTNYNISSWTADFPITVTTRPITVTLGGSKLVDGNQTPTGATGTITVGSLAPGDSLSCSYANTSSSAAGPYTGLATATITNGSAPTNRTTSYAITYNGSYQIQSQQNPQATVTVSGPSTMVYGNTPTATVAAGSGSGTGAIGWLLGTAGASPAPGPGIVSATGVVSAAGTGNVWIKARRAADTNYLISNWSADFTVSVTARPLTVTLAGSKTYDGTATGTGATLTVTSGSLAAGDVLATYAAPSATAAAYPLSSVVITNGAAPTTRTGSYSLTYVGSYTISKATITAATIAPLTYTGTSQQPSVLSTSTPTGATAAISATAGQTNAGTYSTGTVSGNGNFQGSLSGVSWTINPAIPTGTFTGRVLGTTSPAGYTVAAGQLNATFAGPSGAPAPSGAKTYALAPGTPSGTAGMVVSAGTVLPVGVYKVRATIAASAPNYTSAPVDSQWTVTDDVDGDGVPGYIEIQIGTDPNVANPAETSPSNPTGLQIQRPNQ